MQYRYRTSDGEWGDITYPFIFADRHKDAFALTAFMTPEQIQAGHMIAGVFDVMEFHEVT